MENLNELKPVGKLSPFTHFCCTIGNLPTSYMISLTYEEQLLWLCNYLEKTVIPAVNTNAEAVEELQNLYIQLKNYVDNYFDNLDVQQEINNKLDQMVQNGTFQVIIDQFLKINSVLTFTNVEEMKNSDNLVVGSSARTMGYYTLNDGGGSLYRIIENNDLANDSSYILLNNGLVAELIIEDVTISPEQFGCYGNGVNDDTVNLQKCIDYAIANKLNIVFLKQYLVTPTLRNDNTRVCLTVFRDSADNSHMHDTNIEFYFKRESCIFTNDTSNCTLLRFNISNISFVNAFLKGTINKTILIEFSKINQLDENEIQWTCHNIFRNLKLMNCLSAIEMQGNSYYNTFDKFYIRDCAKGLNLVMTTLEKEGIKTGSNVNRNEFLNGIFNSVTESGIRIEYGDTNKFVNISFEGVANPIYLDDPQEHKTDFPIAPKWFTNDNMFLNITTEAISGTPIYNNSTGFKIVNTSIRYESCEFKIVPQLFLGGVDNSNSIETALFLFKNLEDVAFPNTPKNSIVNGMPNGFVSTFYSDYDRTGSSPNYVYNTLSRKSYQFDESKITNLKPDTSLVYENVYKVVTKQIGGIVFLTTKFKMQVNDTNANIILPLPTDTMGHNNNFGQFGNIPSLSIPVVVNINNKDTLVIAKIGTDKITLFPPDGGWSNNIIVFINTHWYRDTLAF